MKTRITLILGLTMSTLALATATAYASLADEVNAGKAIAARVDAGSATCQNLSDTDFEHLGEYVMERTLGSRSAHEAMNARMDAMMGSENADRMHAALGRRYAGCATGASGTAGMGGAGMMGGGGMMGGTATGTRGWGAMMGSDLSWMRGGAWQHMSSGDWQRAGAGMMGQGWMHHTGGGWSTGTTIGVILGSLALGGLVYLVLRRPWRHSPSAPRAAH